MRALKLTGRIVGWIVLGALLLVAVTLLTVVIAGRTDWGHRKILAIAQPAIQKQLAGRLRIGAIDGDLTRGLVLHDVEIDDVEHQPAVRVKTLTVRYDLAALVRRTVELTEIRAEQAWVHARPLRDGKLNLAELAKPSESESQQPSPWAIHVGKVWAEVEGRWDRPARGDAPAQTVHGYAHVEGRASIDHGTVDATLETLQARTLTPLHASLVGHGGATVDHGAIAAHGLALALHTDGAELRKLLPDVQLRGPWRVELTADGPADKLALSVVARPPAGRLALDARVKTVAGAPGQPPPSVDAIAWTATVSARGLDPAAAVAGAPRGDVRLDARGRGKGAHGTIDLDALVADVAGTHVDAHGSVDTAANGTIRANIASRDLTGLRTVGVKGVAGSLTARARVERTRTHLHVDADVSALGLKVRDNRVAKLDLHVHSQDFLGEAHVAGEGIRAGGLVLDTVKIDASGDPKRVQATVAARGPDKTSLDFVADGTPTVQRHRGVHGVKIVGADLIIEKLQLARYGQTWASTGPATVRVHDGVEVAGLELASGAQHLGLDGRYVPRSGAIAASLRAQKLNIKELSRLGKPSLDLPDTDLAIEAHVGGTRARPVAEVKLEGFSERSERLGLNRIHYHLTAGYADERARAEWTLTAIDQSFHGKVDVPTVLTGNRPIAADLSASNIWMVKLRKVLPPALANVDGRLDGSIKASGTTQRPVLSVDLHGRGWSLGPDYKDNDVRVRVDYQERTANARAEIHLQQSLGRDAGALVAQVEVPLELSAAQLQRRERFIERLEHETPLAVLVSASHLDLARFPFDQLGFAPPVSAGMIDAAARLRGTVHAPALDVEVEAHGMKRGKLDHIDLFAALAYGNREALVKVDASLRGRPLLHVNGRTPLDVPRLIEGAPYQTTPVRVDAEIPGYDLSRLADLMPKLAGRVDGKATVRGTLGQPTGKLDLAIAGLNLGEVRYDKFAAHGDFDGARLVATLDAHEVKGGTLAANATLPVDAQQPIAATLRANGFFIDVENLNLTNPRLLKGTLDAQLDVRGPRANPTIEGFARLDHGQLALEADPRVYEDIAIDASISGGTLTLKNAQAKIADGTLKAMGSARLSGLRPQAVELRAEASKFPIPTGTFGAWLDATVTVHGQATPEGMQGTIVVEKGTANLPKIAGGKRLQKIGPLEDVRFVDARARRAEARRKQAEEQAPTTELLAQIPGPFHVRSKELSTDLAGNLQIAIAGPVIRLTGQVHTTGGWLELLGRRYTIERARVGFGGEAEPNPELDVRLTRELSETRLIIEVHGTAKKPQLTLTSDPPIYDQSQVIAAILSGDPATQRVDDRSLDQKVTGAISGLLVGKIKDQIAPNLPIDVIKVDTGTEGATGLADTRVEVGKYITDTIYVSYVHQFGSTFVGTRRVNANEANLEWRFKKHFELETAFGDAAVGRVNLFWTMRY